MVEKPAAANHSPLGLTADQRVAPTPRRATSAESSRLAGSTGLRNRGPEPKTSGGGVVSLRVDVDESFSVVVEVDEDSTDVDGAVVVAPIDASEHAATTSAARVHTDHRTNIALITPERRPANRHRSLSSTSDRRPERITHAVQPRNRSTHQRENRQYALPIEWATAGRATRHEVEAN